jgi:hypothetical protein
MSKAAVRRRSRRTGGKNLKYSLILVPTLDRLLVIERVFFFGVTAEQIGKILRERRPRHDRVTPSLLSLDLELALDMREEADDRDGLLQLGAELGDQRERLDVVVVQVDDDQCGTIVLRDIVAGALKDRFGGLDELDLDAELAGGLIDFRQEEQVFDEAEDPGRRVLADGRWRDLLGAETRRRRKVAVRHTAGAVTTEAILILRLDEVAEVILSVAVTVIHRTDESGRDATAAAGAIATTSSTTTTATLVLSAALMAGTRLPHLLLGRAVVRAGLLLAAAATPAAVIASTTPARLHLPLGLRLRLRRLIHFIFHRCVCLLV